MTIDGNNIGIEEGPAAGVDLYSTGIRAGEITLGAIEEEHRRMSHQLGQVAILGKIGDLISNPRAKWIGPWSVDERIRKGELTQADVDNLLKQIPGDYVPTAKGALVRCIDERYEVSYKPGTLEKLGPMIPGGTLSGSTTYRLVVSDGLEDFINANMEEDVHEFAEKNLETGFLPADHVSEADSSDEIGCIAVAEQEEALHNINPNNILTISGLTRGILGTDFRPDQFKDVTSSIIFLASAAPDYFLPIQKQKELILSLNSKALPVLAGPHNGVGLMINKVPYTTLLTNKISHRSDHKLQMFNYDMWYSQIIASKLFPHSKEAQSKYVHGRVMGAIATFMQISDGSHIVGIRTPVDSSAK